MPTRTIHIIARLTVAFVWLWHGLVPKLIVQHPDEYTPILAMGVNQEIAEIIVGVSGWGEIVFGFLILLLWNARWPFWLTIVAMSGLLLGVFFTSPTLALGAFNPVTLNLLVIATSLIALLSSEKSKRSNTTISTAQ